MTSENKKKWAEEGGIMYPSAFIDPGKVDPLIKLMVDHQTAFMPMVLNDLAGLTPRARYYEQEVASLNRNIELR